MFISIKLTMLVNKNKNKNKNNKNFYSVQLRTPPHLNKWLAGHLKRGSAEKYAMQKAIKCTIFLHISCVFFFVFAYNMKFCDGKQSVRYENFKLYLTLLFT